ncbi:TylF/MycF/NovP-related O-methyltransferase [Methylomagnum sp.]
MGNYKLDAISDIYEVENNFYLRSDPSRLAKLIAHYELYKRILNLAGSIVEVGVYKGASLMRFLSFRNFFENDAARKVIGFDAFGVFPTSNVSSQADIEFIKRFEQKGGQGIAIEDLEEAIKKKGFKNVGLVAGDVFETVPTFIEQAPQTRIALLHLDLDVYEPTKFCLDQLRSRMVPGGIVMFDDYNMVEGATRAADELARESGRPIEKLPFYEVPAFITM